MMIKRSLRFRLAAAGAATAVVALAGGAYADTSNTQTVKVLALAGTRTLSVENLQGNPLSGLTLGTGHTGAFLVNVTDVDYQNVGYQVTSELSNLYPYKNGTYDFNGTPIPSSDVTLGFSGTNPLDLTNVGSVVTPVISLTGDLSSLTSSLLTALGLVSLPSGINLNLSTTIDGAATTVSNLASEILDGLANDLPIQVQTGSGGNYAKPGPMTGVNGAPSGDANPTQLVVMQGSPHSVSGLLNDLLNQLSATAGVVPISTLISDGILSETDVLAAVQSATGLPLDFVTANANTILSLLTATITGLDGILGQTGSYTSLPILTAHLPSGIAAGTYQGILTVTLMDTPSS